MKSSHPIVSLWHTHDKACLIFCIRQFVQRDITSVARLLPEGWRRFLINSRYWFASLLRKHAPALGACPHRAFSLLSSSVGSVFHTNGKE
jgi:hypothetical protein